MNQRVIAVLVGTFLALVGTLLRVPRLNQHMGAFGNEENYQRALDQWRSDQVQAARDVERAERLIREQPESRMRPRWGHDLWGSRQTLAKRAPPARLDSTITLC